MSSALLLAALSHGSVAPDLDCEAIRHTPSGEASGGGKKRHCEDEADAESPKKAKREGPFKPKPEVDGPLQCIFIERECIPLWPLYSHKVADGTFIRVDRGESWLNQLIVASRKSVLEEINSQEGGEKAKPFSRTLTTRVCNGLLTEFRRAVSTAKTDYGSRKLPEVITIKMHQFSVTAIAHAKHFHVVNDAKTIRWLHGGLHAAVKKYIEEDAGAMRHTASKLDTSPMSLRERVRDKINWFPEKCQWVLNCKKCPDVQGKIYCREHGFNLQVPQDLRHEEFEGARRKAFRDACIVWNAVDKSGRRRIKILEDNIDMSVSMVPVVKKLAISHTDCPSDSDASPLPVDDIDLFGDF